MGIDFYLYLSLFFFGLIVGSFLNSIIYRLSIEESFLFKRSYCPRCKHILNWQDLFPVFSFLILRGKCRYCHQKISWQYPLVEILTGLIFLLIFNLQSSIYNLPFLIFNLIISCFLIVIFVYDLKHYIIPDKVVYPAIAISFLYRIIFNFQFQISNYLYSALGAAAFFLIIVLISQGKWMGVGDIKLAFLMGLILGWPNILVALFLAFLIGAIIGLMLIAFGKKKLKSEVPFAPFLVTGTFLALFLGERIINFYFKFLLFK